jgi:hypothetical protein
MRTPISRYCWSNDQCAVWITNTSTFDGLEDVCAISGAGIAEQRIMIEVSGTRSSGAADTAAIKRLQRWCREYLNAAAPPAEA